MIGGQPIRIQLGKILWENFAGNLVGKSCGKSLQENLAGNTCRKILQEILVGKSCGKFLWEMLWEIPHTYLKTISEGNFQNMQFI